MSSFLDTLRKAGIRPSSPGGNTFGAAPKPAAPRPTTPGGNTFAAASKPPPNLYGGTVPAPAQRAPSGPVYTPPVQQPVYVDPRITNPNDNWAQPILPRTSAPATGGGGGGGNAAANNWNGGGGGSSAASEAPSNPQGGWKWYNSLSPEQKKAEDEKYLGGDSDYTAQLGEYEKALNDFITRIKNQKDNFDTDANLATTATQQNGTIAANSLGEDFGARNLLFSGMAAKSQEDLATRFNDQVKNIALVNQRNKAEADNREQDYRSENTIGRSNAMRSALMRMSAKQQLLDSGAGF